jgi:outer membrane protein
MKLSTVISIISLVISLGVTAYLALQASPSKSGYVINQKVFDEFNGKKHLEASLKDLRAKHKKHLDSLMALLTVSDQGNAQAVYGETLNAFAVQEQELSDRYTTEIWKQINQYITEYGKKNGYGFIYGATGDGSLMFAHEGGDVTPEVITFINAKYEAE